ncbi:MAG: phage holin family protein [Firmicutes bacterium]|nr:phage holin family protein [Bacillota bacterium]
MVPGLIFRWVTNALGLLLVAQIVHGIRIEGFGAALVAAAILGIVNALIRPVLRLLTLPLNVLTLGLFTFVLNALILLMVDAVTPGFEVLGFWAAFWGSILLSIISAVLTSLVRDQER